MEEKLLPSSNKGELWKNCLSLLAWEMTGSIKWEMTGVKKGKYLQYKKWARTGIRNVKGLKQDMGNYWIKRWELTGLRNGVKLE